MLRLTPRDNPIAIALKGCAYILIESRVTIRNYRFSHLLYNSELNERRAVNQISRERLRLFCATKVISRSCLQRGNALEELFSSLSEQRSECARPQIILRARN